jgi:hypothetical protein
MKGRFLRALAAYLVGDQVMQSIRLDVGDPGAARWAALRTTTPLMGYPSMAEAESLLGEWLGITPLPAPVQAKKSKTPKKARRSR